MSNPYRNEEMRQSAMDALGIDSEPAAPSGQGLDAPATMETEQSAPPEAEHAEEPSTDTPDTPGPDAGEPSPPAERRLLADRYETEEELVRGYKEAQAQATRQAQALARQEAELAQLRAEHDALLTQQLYATPLEQLSDDQLVQLDQEAQASGFPDAQTYRASKLMLDNALHNQRMEAFIRSHPNYQADREAVAHMVLEDPGFLVVPPNLPVQQRERVLQKRVNRLFELAAVERVKREASAKLSTATAEAERRVQKQAEMKKAAAATSQGRTATSTPTPQPRTPRDAGDELLADREATRPFWRRR